MNNISIKTPAKLNIRLKVLGKRPDGYHDLVSIMVPIALYDELDLQKAVDPNVTLISEGFSVPNNESNLVCRAVKAFREKSGLSQGILIRLKKNIPVAAGMGGGSSDAAATLMALNRMLSAPLSMSDLHEIAVKLGADVPFFLDPRPVIARGIGDLLEPLNDWPALWYVIVHPPLEISTSWVYANLKIGLTEDDDGCIKNVLKHGFSPIAHLLENDLEKVTIAHYPVIHSIKQHLFQAGAQGALMTGSGPSVFGLFSSLSKAQQAGRDLASLELGDIFVTGAWTGES